MTSEINSMLDSSRKIALEDPEKAYAIAMEAFELAQKNNLLLELGKACYAIAYSCRVMSDYTRGLKYAFKALDIFEDLMDSSEILKVRNIIGIIYFYYGDYKTALENFMIASDLLENEQNYILKSSVLNNIGEIYRMASDYKKASDYYYKSLDISEKNNLLMNIPIINANIGEIYYLQKDYINANTFFNKSYKNSLNTNDRISQGEAKTKLGRINFAQGNYDQAREHFISALQLFNEVNNKFYLIEVLIDLSELDQKIGRNPKQNLMEALNYAIENKLGLKISLIYKRLVDYHESNGEFEMALNYHKLYYQKEKEIEVSNLSMKLELLALEFNYYKEKSEFEQTKKLSEKLTREVQESKEELKGIKEQNENLIGVSIIDELTQIYNRRGINKLLSERLGKNIESLDLILMIDIDYFKNYNDYWGHLKGDHCLQLITSRLKDLDYDNYFVGRYGGEEFICYMRVKDLNMAIEIAENIRKLVLGLKIGYTDDIDSEMVSVSIGGVVDKMVVSKIDEYIDVADKWLYKSKDNGRNKVSITKSSKS